MGPKQLIQSDSQDLRILRGLPTEEVKPAYTRNEERTLNSRNESKFTLNALSNRDLNI